MNYENAIDPSLMEDINSIDTSESEQKNSRENLREGIEYVFRPALRTSGAGENGYVPNLEFGRGIYIGLVDGKTMFRGHPKSYPDEVFFFNFESSGTSHIFEPSNK
ncbi:MAG: hypothetical protein WC107_00950 [Patescibacteria group bacterium]